MAPQKRRRRGIHITHPKAVNLVSERAEIENRSEANCAANAIINYYKTQESQSEKSTEMVAAGQ